MTRCDMAACAHSTAQECSFSVVGDGSSFVVDQTWLAAVLDKIGVMSCEPITPADVLREVGNAERRRVEALREADRIGQMLHDTRERLSAYEPFGEVPPRPPLSGGES